MKTDLRLAYEVNKHAVRRKIAAVVFWSINAFGSFAFGFAFCWPLAIMFVPSWLFSDGTAMTIAQVAGGVWTLALLDGAWPYWYAATQYDAETPTQLGIANAMAVGVFLVSLMFTGIMFAVTLGGDYLTADQIASLTWFGTIMLTLVTMSHIAAAVGMMFFSPSHKARRAAVNQQAKLNAQASELTTKTMQEALLSAAEAAEAERGRHVDDHGKTILNKLLNAIANDENVVTVLTPAESFAAESPRGDVAIEPNETDPKA